MHSKPQKRTAELLTYRKSWKLCSTAKTKARITPPFGQPSCVLRSAFEEAQSRPASLSLRLARPQVGGSLSRALFGGKVSSLAMHIDTLSALHSVVFLGVPEQPKNAS